MSIVCACDAAPSAFGRHVPCLQTHLALTAESSQLCFKKYLVVKPATQAFLAKPTTYCWNSLKMENYQRFVLPCSEVGITVSSWASVVQKVPRKLQFSSKDCGLWPTRTIFGTPSGNLSERIVRVGGLHCILSKDLAIQCFAVKVLVSAFRTRDG